MTVFAALSKQTLLIVVGHIRIFFELLFVYLFRSLQVLAQHFSIKFDHNRIELKSVFFRRSKQKGRFVTVRRKKCASLSFRAFSLLRKASLSKLGVVSPV